MNKLLLVLIPIAIFLAWAAFAHAGSNPFDMEVASLCTTNDPQLVNLSLFDSKYHFVGSMDVTDAFGHFNPASIGVVSGGLYWYGCTPAGQTVSDFHAFSGQDLPKQILFDGVTVNNATSLFSDVGVAVFGFVWTGLSTVLPIFGVLLGIGLAIMYVRRYIVRKRV